MARNKKDQANIDQSNLADYPDGRIKNNTGGGDGTPVNEITKGDIHEFFDKLMRLYGISHNGLPDNVTNGYQLVDAVKALASKNDFVLSLSTAADVLTVPVKLGKLLNDESIILKASADKGTETTIKGTLDGTTKSVTFLGDFKANEYVRMINTAASVVLVRMVDSFNLDLAVSEALYLKKASQVEEDDGDIDTVATTPEVNKVTFAKRVNGVDSGNYLATPTGGGQKNGLLSHEDKKKIDDFQSKERNYGVFGPFDVDSGSVNDLYAVTGDLTKAQITTRTGNGQIITVTLANPMDNTTYEVVVGVESAGTMEADNDIHPPVWKKVSTTQFQVYIEETGGTLQAIKCHIQVIQR